MKDPPQELLLRNFERLDETVRVVAASVDRTADFDPDIEYSPEELEPYDALSDRSMRAVESTIRFFRSYERFTQAVSSETFRNLLHGMDKLDLVSDVELWMDMREVRNRVVHDYAPDQRQQLYSDIRGPFFSELQYAVERARSLSAIREALYPSDDGAGARTDTPGDANPDEAG